MAVRRKLFLIHASELAHRLVRTVSDGGLAVRFVRSYAQRYNRPGLVSNPERLRELGETIGREALLVMAAELRHIIPNAFAQTRSGALRPDEAALASAFFAEFLQSLGRSLEWPEREAADEADAFRRDLELYQRGNRYSQARSGGAAKPGQVRESPFSDRCAMLLDSAMMEQARRAASPFEAEIARTAARTFSQLGRHAASRAPRPAKPARPRPRRRTAPKRRPRRRPRRRPTKARRPARDRRRRKLAPPHFRGKAPGKTSRKKKPRRR